MSLTRALLAGLLVMIPTLGQAADTRASGRPNLIAIVTDDQARWAMGSYGGPGTVCSRRLGIRVASCTAG